MTRKINAARAFVVGVAVCSTCAPRVHAGEAAEAAVVTDEEIEQALSPAPRTRGLTTRGLTTRGITVKEREEEQTERQAAIDLSVPFELNSSQLQPTAVAQLRQLESALQSSALRSSRFLIAGHTDGTGNPAYNQDLSMRRAESVRQYLVAAGIDAARLEAQGFGAAQLLTPDQPADPANRRVEIRNLGELP